MGQAKLRGTYEDRRANPTNVKAVALVAAPRFVHVSKVLVKIISPMTFQPEFTVTKAPGTTYRAETIKSQDRSCRRRGLKGERFMSARQMRINNKTFSANEKAESLIDAQIAAHEIELDRKDDERDESEFMREQRASDLHEEHFS